MKTQPHEPAHPAPEGPAGFKGLTKREHFAALLFQGFLAAEGDEIIHIDKAAEECVKAADALIEALNK